MAVNALSPFILNGQLRSMLSTSPAGNAFVINVSAMEGKNPLRAVRCHAQS
jgi:hypothetical protein